MKFIVFVCSSLFACLLLCKEAISQDENISIDSIVTISSRKLEKMETKIENLNADFDKTTQKYLSRLVKRERKLEAILARKDSVLSFNLFGELESKYKTVLAEKFRSNHASKIYNAPFDSLLNVMKFLNGGVSNNSKTPQLLKETIEGLNVLEGNLAQAQDISEFLNNRRKLLEEQFHKFGLSNKLKKYSKDIAYYKAQANEYNEIIKNPDLIERKILEKVSALPAFQSFFANNSQIASLFVLPGKNSVGEGGPEGKALQGIQNRSSVYAALNEKAGTSGIYPGSEIQGKIDEAQNQVQNLKNKLASLMEGSVSNGNPEMQNSPKINDQRTKSLGKRIIWGFNLQSQRARSFFPSRSDIGIFAGYKLTDNLNAGIGGSYSIGWGSGFQNIKMTHLGIGLRSFVEYKIKGNFFASGGFEMNFNNLIKKVEVLKTISSWQKSGLIGITKKYKVGKLLKGNAQFLWDFLSYQQMPHTQPFLFRIGYSIK